MKPKSLFPVLPIVSVACLVNLTGVFAQTSNIQTAHPIAATAPTAVPALVSYSSVALNSDGNALTSETSITFLIYNEAQGGESLFTETQTVIPDPTGHYKIQLGATLASGIPQDLFSSGEARWLEVQIAGQPPQPRVLLASVPYALKAADAATLGGLPASAYALAGTKSAANLATPAITPDTAIDVTTTGGTSGYVPVFSGASTVVDSPFFVNGANVGVGTTTPGANFEVKGTSILDGSISLDGATTAKGTVILDPKGTATATAGSSSQQLQLQASAYNLTAGAATSQTFTWQVLPVNNNTPTAGGVLDLLFAAGANALAPTGLSVASNGLVTFAPGQIFPGTGDGTITGVTAGTALTGGGTSGKVTLNLDTTKVPLLASANTFSTNQSITGTLSTTGSISTAKQLTSTVATGTAPLSVTSTTVVPNLNASLLGGFAPSTFANLSAANAFTATQSFSKVGIGTATPRSLLELSASASKALGPVLTLTNTLGNLGAGSALDFNTTRPSTTGTYNPMARIVAQDADMFSDNLLFQSNVPGAQNHGLQTNMIIESSGQVGIGVLVPSLDTAYQLSVLAEPNALGGAILAIGSTYGDGDGTVGVVGDGGDTADDGSSCCGGDGGDFFGGFTFSSDNGGTGVYGEPGGSLNGYAGWAGYFDGDVNVSGMLYTPVEDFKIDHPLDPANKYLVHASVESSEMMNIYSGNVTTDELGLATVQLPDWFEVENTDFRYQLTVIGRKAQAWIAEEVGRGQFKIASDATDTKISWQITAVRQDAYAKAHPLVVEEAKPAREVGFYQHPELYGQPRQKQTEWGRNPKMMQRMEAQRAANKARQANAINRQVAIKPN